jgi:hypothetical protein
LEYPASVLKTWGMAQVDAVVPIAFQRAAVAARRCDELHYPEFGNVCQPIFGN